MQSFTVDCVRSPPCAQGVDAGVTEAQPGDAGAGVGDDWCGEIGECLGAADGVVGVMRWTPAALALVRIGAFLAPGIDPQ